MSAQAIDRRERIDERRDSRPRSRATGGALVDHAVRSCGLVVRPDGRAGFSTAELRRVAITVRDALCSRLGPLEPGAGVAGAYMANASRLPIGGRRRHGRPVVRACRGSRSSSRRLSSRPATTWSHRYNSFHCASSQCSTGGTAQATPSPPGAGSRSVTGWRTNRSLQAWAVRSLDHDRSPDRCR